MAAAFHPLGRHWHGGWVFPELTYPEFLARLAQLLKRQAGLGAVERLLFRPWLNPPGEGERAGGDRRRRARGRARARAAGGGVARAA